MHVDLRVRLYWSFSLWSRHFGSSCGFTLFECKGPWLITTVEFDSCIVHKNVIFFQYDIVCDY